MSDYDRGWCAAMETLDDDPVHCGFVSEALVRGMLNEIRDKAKQRASTVHPESDMDDIRHSCDEYLEALEDNKKLLALGVRWAEKGPPT